jgi:hypothetical protein
VVLGTGLALFPDRRATLVLRPATEKSWGDAISQGAGGTPATSPVASAPIRRSGADD